METISRLLITYLANSVWMTCLIAVVAMILGKLMTRCPSAYRHRLWAAALIASSLLPISGVWSTTDEAHHDAAIMSVAADSSRSAAEGADGAITRSFWLKMRHPMTPILFAPLLTWSLSAFYIGFLAFRVAGFFWGWHRTRRILRDTSPWTFPSEAASATECAFSVLTVMRVSLARSSQLEAPAVVGLWKPVLVLPDWFVSNCSREELTSTLWHELAHVRRHDFLLNMIYEIFLVPISFHPAAWFMKKRVERTRELACDEAAAKQLPTPVTYARSLLSIAQRIAARSSTAPSSYALGLFDTNTLEERVIQIMRKNQFNKKWGRTQALFAFCILAVACLATSIFSVQVALAAAPGDANRFAGTWAGKFKDKPFVTIKLSAKEGKVSGTVSRFSLEMNGGGGVTSASAIEGEDAIVEAAPEGDVLHLVTKAKGKVDGAGGESDESVQCDMRLTRESRAELQIAGMPPGMPVPKPWTLERNAAQK